MKLLQGIDIVEVERVQKLMARHGRSSRRRIFTAAECRYCESRRRKYEHYAARFAAKEAVRKVLSGCSSRVCEWHEIEIGHHATGRPLVKIASQARKRLGLSKKVHIEISLSHEREYAVAAVLLYER